ncbi:MAG: hypothetical protein IJV48_00225 [Ruminococcus sp.]|nr:hypothetical protein [Ruminococcus sp.]
MNKDFHYYATYCAAYLAGYSHEESLAICYSAQFVDWCTVTYLSTLKAPRSAATTQLQLEMMDVKMNAVGLQDITRIWASFHFLPYDLYAQKPHCSKRYLNKYRLICKPNGDLLVDTVKLAKDKSLQAVGVAMHVLADTWAHSNFAGTPSLVINNTDHYFYELIPDGDGFRERPIKFSHNPGAGDDIEKGVYVNTLYRTEENTIMNLGHGRAGHLPDYSFIRYKYLPAWGDYEEVVKDNPSDYYHAFCQMVCAMRYLRGELPEFEKDTYDTEKTAPWEKEIKAIITKRQPDSCGDWRALGEKLSGRAIEDFDLDKYRDEYLAADKDGKDDTFLGRFILAALSQKSMVTGKIFRSGNKLAGYSVDMKKGFRGIRDYRKLIKETKGAQKDDRR